MVALRAAGPPQPRGNALTPTPLSPLSSSPSLLVERAAEAAGREVHFALRLLALVPRSRARVHKVYSNRMHADS